jgi:hypothetical protein
MDNNMIIGLAGKKRAGKTTVAKYLCFTRAFREESWAFPLKEVIGRKLFGLTDGQLYGSTEERESIIPEWGKSPRQILQVVGTDLFRERFDQDIWVKLGIKRLNDIIGGYTSNIIFSDCRFSNELDALRWFSSEHDIPFAAIQVIRKGFDMNDDHASEHGLDGYKFDYIVEAGEGKFQLLYSQIDEVIDAIRKK